MPTTCVRCGKEVGLLELVTFNRHTGRCSKCTNESLQALNRFRGAFLNYSSTHLTPEKWDTLLKGASMDRLDLREALAFIQKDALNIIERTLAFASANRGATAEDERYVQYLLRTLAIPPQFGHPLLGRLSYLKQLEEIRQGKLPRSHTTVRLETDEICHLEMPASHYKPNTKTVTVTPGRFVATNKKLRFLSVTKGQEINWKNMMRVEMSGNGVYLELTIKSGNGFYAVPDPMLVEVLFDALMRRARYQLPNSNQSASSRHIPDEVKRAVYQRDGGKCVRCSATEYLEFDHIIPFTKGGASSVNNVQLLCRKCNLEKSDRI